MLIFEAMVKVSREDCPLCAPGTTFKGTHENIVHMTTPAKDMDTAKAHFKTMGILMSKVHEVGTTNFG